MTHESDFSSINKCDAQLKQEQQTVVGHTGNKAQLVSSRRTQFTKAR
jgi:hypothetical protein